MTVTVTFQLDSDDWKAFLKASKKPFNFARLIFVLIALAMVLAPMLSATLSGSPSPAETTSPGQKAVSFDFWSVGLPLIVTVALFLFLTWAKKAQLRKDPLFTEPLTIATDDEGILATNSQGRDTTFWHSIFKIIETKAHFFVLNAPQAGLIIPKRAFDSPAQCAEFGALLHSKWAQHHPHAAPIAPPR